MEFASDNSAGELVFVLINSVVSFFVSHCLRLASLAMYIVSNSNRLRVGVGSPTIL